MRELADDRARELADGRVAAADGDEWTDGAGLGGDALPGLVEPAEVVQRADEVADDRVRQLLAMVSPDPASGGRTLRATTEASTRTRAGIVPTDCSDDSAAGDDELRWRKTLIRWPS